MFWHTETFLWSAQELFLEDDMKAITEFIADQDGADLIEYALLAALVSLAATVTLTNVGSSLSGLYTKMSTKITSINIQ